MALKHMHKLEVLFFLVTLVNLPQATRDAVPLAGLAVPLTFFLHSLVNGYRTEVRLSPLSPLSPHS